MSSFRTRPIPTPPNGTKLDWLLKFASSHMGEWVGGWVRARIYVYELLPEERPKDTKYFVGDLGFQGVTAIYFIFPNRPPLASKAGFLKKF